MTLPKLTGWGWIILHARSRGWMSRNAGYHRGPGQGLIVLLSVPFGLPPPALPLPSSQSSMSLSVGELWAELSGQRWAGRASRLTSSPPGPQRETKRRGPYPGPRRSWQDVAFQEVERWILPFVLLGGQFSQDSGDPDPDKFLLATSTGSAHASCEDGIMACVGLGVCRSQGKCSRDRDKDQIFTCCQWE